MQEPRESIGVNRHAPFISLTIMHSEACAPIHGQLNWLAGWHALESTHFSNAISIPHIIQWPC